MRTQKLLPLTSVVVSAHGDPVFEDSRIGLVFRGAASVIQRVREIDLMGEEVSRRSLLPLGGLDRIPARRHGAFAAQLGEMRGLVLAGGGGLGCCLRSNLEYERLRARWRGFLAFSCSMVRRRLIGVGCLLTSPTCHLGGIRHVLSSVQMLLEALLHVGTPVRSWGAAASSENTT